MRYSTIASALVAFFASATLAQNLTGLPDCAVTCFDDNFANSSCDDTDTACLCADTTFYDDVETCVLADCDTADQITTLEWSEAECDD